MMKRILLLLLWVCSACALCAGHYQPVDKHTYSSRATIIAQVYLDGQLLTGCEVGAFDQNGECRGADAEHGANSQNTVWLYIHGQQQNNDVISFRVAVFDEYGNYEREYIALQQYVFTDDDIIGSVSSPYIIRIESGSTGMTDIKGPTSASRFDLLGRRGTGKSFQVQNGKIIYLK